MADDDDKDPEAMDSDEEDEDYVPGVDPDERGGASDDDENDATAGVDAAAHVVLSITRQKAVDDAFFDLFGYHYTPTASTTKSLDKIPCKSKRLMSKQRSILSSIFGKRSTIKLISHAGATAALARPKPSSEGGMIRLEKRVVAEVKRFAGQEIRVERMVMVPVMAGEDGEKADASQTMVAEGAASSSSAAESTTRQKAKGVDNLLTELSRPEKLSTISKTSADWDLFKTKNADVTLKEQLESSATGNEAYLVKKDFLNRVDHRRFELEKVQRERERSKRGK